MLVHLRRPVKSNTLKAFRLSQAGLSEDAATRKSPRLVEVPSLPLAGSLIPRHSGAPALDRNKLLDFFPEMRRRFGDFYRYGLPGLGVGAHGTVHVLTDPVEMEKVVRHDNKYPSGLVQNNWALSKCLRDLGSAIVDDIDGGYFGNGETWRRLRSFLQKDLLSPTSAAGYIPGMIQVATFASQGAPKAAADFSTYTNHVTFDMFNSVMFGEFTRLADPSVASLGENIEFCQAACRSINAMLDLQSKPLEVLSGKILKMETKVYKQFVVDWSATRKVAAKKIASFRDKFQANDLNETEVNSYLAHAIRRHGAQGATASEDEMTELCMLALTAAVDTTATLINWVVIHLALNPTVQDKLYNELMTATQGGKLTADMFMKSSKLPYLHAIFRESHRLTPAIGATSIIKRNDLSDIELHGEMVPKGSVICLDSYSVGMDPAFIDGNPTDFLPERFLTESVEARTGTPAEVLDHPYYKAPFSQGARMCPGARVATNEALVMVSQLILDWKISVDKDTAVQTWRDIAYTFGLIQPSMPMLSFESRF